MFQFTGRQVAIGSGSTSTSNAWYVGDFQNLTVSIVSSASLGPTNVVIQASNADGFQQADLGGPTSQTGWSNITIVLPATLQAGLPVGTGVFTFSPIGYRWVRSFVSPTLHSVASAMTVTFAGTSF